MRGVGKTTIGKQLAKKINWPFIDIDQKISTKLNKKIAQIVKEKGWEEFRKLEAETAEEVAKLNNHIISTGGGTYMDSRNAELLSKNSTVVWLQVESERAKKWLQGDTKRPSLTGANPLDEYEEVLKKREPIYRKYADVNFEIKGWDNAIDELCLLYTSDAADMKNF